MQKKHMSSNVQHPSQKTDKNIFSQHNIPNVSPQNVLSEQPKRPWYKKGHSGTQTSAVSNLFFNILIVLLSNSMTLVKILYILSDLNLLLSRN